MKILKLLLILLFLPSLAKAGWVLQQSDDGHWVTGQNRERHQLIISQNGTRQKILLVLNLGHNGTHIPHTARLTIDQSEPTEYPLEIIKQRSNGVALQLIQDDTEHDTLINQLVHGLNLSIRFDEEHSTDFSLDGFTNTFSDFLIANDLGKLDPHWLQMQNYGRELVCYEIARALVDAMKLRKAGKTAHEAEAELHGRMSDEAGQALTDIIDQTYSVPSNRLPRIPSTRKYEFFKRCLQKLK